jgi:DNA-binding CsgD family transcriptional regulator
MAGRTAASAVGLERRFGLDLAALAGDVLTRLGRWNEAEDVVRDAFRLDPRDEGTTYLAAVHARLLALRGDAEGAARRISTIDLSLQDPDVAAFSAAVRAEAALAVGRPEAAAVDVSVGLDHLEGLDDVLWTAPLVGLGLRAVADLADGPPSTDGASDGVDPLAVAARLRSKTGWLAARATTASGRAWVALARAEASRIERPDVPAWEAAVVAWDAVPDPFRAAYARFRLAEARLRAEGLRADAGPDLRSAYEVVTHMGASPLRRQVERLASRARLALEAPSAPVALEIEPPAEPSPARRERRPHRLSERELEVLSLVAAGRTNGEIADRLFITRKTAAVHVTHILDKLGVTNRVEAAMVAARLGLVGEDDDATN